MLSSLLARVVRPATATRIRKIRESLIRGEDGAAIEAELQFIDQPGREDVELFQFAVHRPGRGKLPIIQTVGGDIAAGGIEVEAKVCSVLRRKMLIQAQHG